MNVDHTDEPPAPALDRDDGECYQINMFQQVLVGVQEYKKWMQTFSQEKGISPVDPVFLTPQMSSIRNLAARITSGEERQNKALEAFCSEHKLPFDEVREVLHEINEGEYMWCAFLPQQCCLLWELRQVATLLLLECTE